MCENCLKSHTTFSPSVPLNTIIDHIVCPSDESSHIFLGGSKYCQCGKTTWPVEQKQAAVIGTYGWICPVCGKGNSPFLSQCPCLGSIGYGVMNGSTDWKIK